jgi:hypothetical protein
MVNLDMPNFDIFYQGCYDEVEVFRPYAGWDAYSEEEPEDNEEQAIIRRLIATRNDNRKLFLEIVEDLYTMQFEGVAILWHPEVNLRVDFYKGMSIIESKDFDKFEVKNIGEQSLDLDELTLDAIKDYIGGEYCVVKVWENTGGCIYRSKSPSSDKKEFDISKLHYDMGQITYDGEEFSITDGDGMSSRTMIFVDGQKLDGI